MTGMAIMFLATDLLKSMMNIMETFINADETRKPVFEIQIDK